MAWNLEAALLEWSGLPPAWQAVFAEMWTSFRLGNFGIGAVLVDGEDRIVSRGRNMVAVSQGDQRLHGNYMAHAEMNLFAQMPTYDARGHHLLSSLEPCLMCAATALFLNVDSVRFIAPDEYFVNLNDLWRHHAYTAPRAVPTTQAFAGPLVAFARLLPLSHTFKTLPDSSQAEAARSAYPALAHLAADRAFIETLRTHEDVDQAYRWTLPHLIDSMAEST